MRWLAAQEARLHAGERGKAIDELDQGAKLLGALRATTDEILQEEARLDTVRMSRLQRSMSRQFADLGGRGDRSGGHDALPGLHFLERRDQTAGHPEGKCPPIRRGKRTRARPSCRSDEIAEVDRAFHEMASSLDQQKQENEMFVYSVSHDLRSPLINLQGFSEELSLSYRELERLLRHEQIPPAIRD